MSSQSCLGLVSTFSSRLRSELYVFIRHLLLGLDGGWHFRNWIGLRWFETGVRLSLWCYIRSDRRTHRETVRSDRPWQFALPVCLLFQTTRLDIHGWACTSKLTPRPFSQCSGERMCKGDSQTMMRSDISWEISVHKQRNVYNDTS